MTSVVFNKTVVKKEYIFLLAVRCCAVLLASLPAQTYTKTHSFTSLFPLCLSLIYDW